MIDNLVTSLVNCI